MNIMQLEIDYDLIAIVKRDAGGGPIAQCTGVNPFDGEAGNCQFSHDNVFIAS